MSAEISVFTVRSFLLISSAFLTSFVSSRMVHFVLQMSHRKQMLLLVDRRSKAAWSNFKQEKWYIFPHTPSQPISPSTLFCLHLLHLDKQSMLSKYYHIKVEEYC